MTVPFQIGPTPNPNSIRVGLSQPMFPKATTVRTALDAGECVLAKELIAIPGVVQVFMLNNFISINKDPRCDWVNIEPKVAEVLLKNLNG